MKLLKVDSNFLEVSFFVNKKSLRVKVLFFNVAISAENNTFCLGLHLPFVFNFILVIER